MLEPPSTVSVVTARDGASCWGEHIFDTDKYLLVLATKAGEQKITLWTRNHETVFAMEDSLLGPGLRIQLNQYKTGSDEADIFEDTARSHGHGDGNTFPVG